MEQSHAHKYKSDKKVRSLSSGLTTPSLPNASICKTGNQNVKVLSKSLWISLSNAFSRSGQKSREQNDATNIESKRKKSPFMKWNSFFRNQKKIEGDPIETVLPQCAKTVVHQTDSASIINDKEVAGANADEEQISFNLEFKDKERNEETVLKTVCTESVSGKVSTNSSNLNMAEILLDTFSRTHLQTKNNDYSTPKPDDTLPLLENVHAKLVAYTKKLNSLKKEVFSNADPHTKETTIITGDTQSGDAGKLEPKEFKIKDGTTANDIQSSILLLDDHVQESEQNDFINNIYNSEFAHDNEETNDALVDRKRLTYENLERDVKTLIKELLEESSEMKNSIVESGVFEEDTPPFICIPVSEDENSKTGHVQHILDLLLEEVDKKVQTKRVNFNSNSREDNILIIGDVATEKESKTKEQSQSILKNNNCTSELGNNTSSQHEQILKSPESYFCAYSIGTASKVPKTSWAFGEDTEKRDNLPSVTINNRLMTSRKKYATFHEDSLLQSLENNSILFKNLFDELCDYNCSNYDDGKRASSVTDFTNDLHHTDCKCTNSERVILQRSISNIKNTQTPDHNSPIIIDESSKMRKSMKSSNVAADKTNSSPIVNVNTSMVSIISDSEEETVLLNIEEALSPIFLVQKNDSPISAILDVKSRRTSMQELNSPEEISKIEENVKENDRLERMSCVLLRHPILEDI